MQKTVSPPVPFRIPLTRPHVTDAVKARVLEVLDSGWLTEGPVTAEFESRFADYVGARHAVAATSCTTGLDASLRAIGVGPGDEVIVPDYTYPATASVVTLMGATCVIVDVERDTMLMDLRAAEAAVTERTKAVVPVPIFGNPLDSNRVRAFAERHGLRVVQDAACAIGTSFEGVRVGADVEQSVFSLHPRKTLACGEGGMITTDDDDLAAWLRTYKSFGIDKERSAWHFQFPGTNYKLSDILAAVGVEMLNELDALLERRDAIAANYVERLGDVAGVEFPRVTAGGTHAWQSFPIFVEDRERVRLAMGELGIQTQIGTHALHTHPAFAPGPLVRVPATPESSAWAFEHCLVLPMYHGMTDAEVDEVVGQLRRLV